MSITNYRLPPYRTNAHFPVSVESIVIVWASALVVLILWWQAEKDANYEMFHYIDDYGLPNCGDVRFRLETQIHTTMNDKEIMSQRVTAATKGWKWK